MYGNIPQSDLSAIERARNMHALDRGWESLKTYCSTLAAKKIINRIFHERWQNHIKGND